MSIAQIGRAADRRDNEIIMRRAYNVAYEASTAAGGEIADADELVAEAEAAQERGSYHKAMRLLKRAVECCVGPNPTNRYNRRLRNLKEHLR
jgi:hypothetical protein